MALIKNRDLRHDTKVDGINPILLGLYFAFLLVGLTKAGVGSRIRGDAYLTQLDG